MKERPILFSAPMVRALLAGTKTQTRRAVKLPHENPLGAWEPITLGGPGCYLDKACTMPDDGPPITMLWHTRTADAIGCPYGKPGDRLWVRESGWERPERTPRMMREGADTWARYYYDADDENAEDLKAWGFKRRSSIHMPRWACRLFLEISGIRVERVQAITEADAIAEGCKPQPFPGPWWQGYRDMAGQLLHQQAIGEEPPDWMIEPKRMSDTKHLDRSAKDLYRSLWDGINGTGSWTANPWVWVVEFKQLSSERTE